MATCNDCKNSVICCIRGRVPADFCASFNPKQKITTNADRIRAMSDEELARYMAELIDNIDSKTCCYSNIPDEWLSWLQQPAEVE